jgi:hypothetical protein
LRADNAYHNLEAGNFSQNWNDTSLISTDDNWSGIPSIIGYRGDGITSATGADPQTLTGEGTITVDVVANITSTTTTSGGVIEMQLTDPVVALQGSGTADAPSLLVHLNATGRQNLQVSYLLRELDTDNAVQPVALQYRVGASGAFTNVPAAYVADAANGASQTTNVSAVLPAAVNNQAQVQIRILTANASGNDSLIGIDDIVVSSEVGSAGVDGLGTAVATNGGAAPLGGTTVFRRNQSGQTVAVALTGVSTAPITTVQVDVPAGWSGLSLGNVALSGSGLSGAMASLADADTIQITGAALTDTATGTVTVSGLTTPNPTALTDTGAYSFPVRTAGASGTLTAIASAPSVQVTIPIINLSDVDANGVALDLGTTVAIEGVATPVGTFTAGALNTFFQDATDGMGTFLAGGSPVTQGNLHVVRGAVAQFQGLTQLSPSSAADVIDLGASTLPDPSVQTLAELLAAPEAFEGRLVRVNNVQITFGDWPTSGQNANLDIRDSSVTGDFLSGLRIDSDTDVDGSVAPTGSFSVVGIFTQADSSSPFDSGYQILPRSQADILGGTSGPVTATLASLTPQPALPIAPGNTDVVLSGFTVAADGSQEFTAVTVTTTGTATNADLSNVRIFWDQDGNGAINGDSAVAGPLAYGSSLAFTGVTGQTFSGTRTFLIVADVAGGATVGRTVTASIASGDFTTSATTKTGSATGAERTIQTTPVVAVGSLFFSEYIEGSSFNKALEIFNNSGQAVDLSDFRIEFYPNGGSTATNIALSGTLAVGDVFVASNNNAAVDATIVAASDLRSGSVNHNGDDAYLLRRISDNAVFDMFGVVGTDPGTAWVDGTHSSADQTLRRKSTVTAGNPVGLNPITNLGGEWDSFPIDTFDGLGTHGGPGSGTTATLAGVTPQPSATIAPGTANAVLARLRLTHSASLDFTAVTLGFAGTATSADVENVRIFRDEDGNGAIDGADAAIAGPSAFAASVPFASLTTAQTFSGARDYLIVADVTVGATSGRTVTASIASGAVTTTADTTTGSATGAERTIQVPVPSTLVINEIDYDQPVSDSAEFVELHNAGPSSVDLTGYTLELVNTGGTVYDTVALTGSIAAGGYLVIGNVPSATVDPGTASNWIQNGSDDAVVLRNASSAIVDAVGYEGSASGVAEGTGTTAADSNTVADVGLSRVPNGTDTGNNDADFQLVTITPGAANSSVSTTAPVLASPTGTGITGTAATLGGDVTSDGGAAVTARGVVYAATATNANPEIGGAGVTQAAGTGTTGVFTVNVTGLTPGTAYSFKAYATNSVGTAYTVAGTFTTLSDNADLSGLALSVGTLTPAFSAATTAYSASVSAATTSITVTATAAQGGAVLEARVNGGTYGSPGAALSLNPGVNTVDVRVTAQDGVTQKVYTVTVTRQGAPTVTTPTSATVTATTATLGGNVTGDGGSTVTGRGVVYAPTATNNNPEIGGTGAVQVAGTGTTGVFTVGVTGLTSGTAYSFKAYATNAEGTSYSPVGTFTTLSSVSTLSNLVLGGGSLSPAFASGTLAYASSVPFTTTSVTVTPTASQGGSTIRVNGVVVASGGTSAAIPLTVGSGNVVSVAVTAPDGVTVSNYTVTVTRRADSRLTNLALSQGTLAPAFASGTLAYTATVAFDVAQITLTPTLSDLAASVTVNGSATVSGTASAPVNLSVGANAIPVIVTATDATTTTYTVTLTRRADPSLASLTLSEGTLDPVFAPGTTAYSASVPGTTSEVLVNPVTSDPSATVTVNGSSPATPVPLALGANVIAVVVTGADGIATRAYTVTVTRTSPEIDVRQGAASLTGGSSSIFLGTASPGTSRSVELRVHNLGQVPLTGLGVSIVGGDEGDFSADLGGVDEVAPGADVPLTVTFTPTVAILRSSSLEITSDDADENPFVIELTGSGDHRSAKPVDVPSDARPDSTITQVSWSPEAAGSYEGVLRPLADASAVAGAITGLTVTSAPDATGGGWASGVVRMDGRSVPIRGRFGLNGLVDLTLPQRDGSVLTVLLQLGRSVPGNHPLIRAVLTWNGQFVVGNLGRAAYSRSAPAPTEWTGRHVLVLPSEAGWGTEEPGGDGWALVNVASSGVLTLSGRLGDGSVYTDTASLSAEGGATLFGEFYRPASQRGWIAGEVTFRDQPGISDFDGRLRWKKYADVRELLYPDGFDVVVWALGGKHVAPAVGQRVLSGLADQEHNAELSLIGPTAPVSGATVGALDRVVSWRANQTLVHFGPERLSGVAVASTGFVSGRFFDPATRRDVGFGGVAFQKQGLAAGTFVNGTKSGALRILPGTDFTFPGSEDAGPLARIATPRTGAAGPAESTVAWDAAAAGLYGGVLEEGGRLRGALESVRLTAAGGISGVVWIDGVRQAFRGTLGGGPISADSGAVLALDLNRIDGSADGFGLAGTVESGGTAFSLDAQRQPVFSRSDPAPQAGRHTVALRAPDGIDGNVAPAGDGYGNVNVAFTGACTGTVVLADGTRTTFAGHVGRAYDDGGTETAEWSFHRALYPTGRARLPRGYLAAKLYFRDVPGVSDVDGAVRWVKQPGAVPTGTYPGFDLSPALVGSRYVAPAAGTRALPGLADEEHNVWLRFLGVDLSSADGVQGERDRVATWNRSNRILHYGPRRLTVTFDVRTGLVSGSCVDGPDGVDLRFGGAVLQKQALATGFTTAQGWSGLFGVEAR